jgi:hypothetical protein
MIWQTFEWDAGYSHEKLRVTVTNSNVMFTQPESGLSPDSSFNAPIPVNTWQKINEFIANCTK